MELIEQVKALEAQQKQHIFMIDNLNAEKVSLDQMLVNSLKECLNAKKEVILKEGVVHQLNQQIAVLKKEKEALQASSDACVNVPELKAIEG